jgi:hypothetical protein
MPCVGLRIWNDAWHGSAAVLAMVWGAREHVVKILIAYAALIRVGVLGERGSLVFVELTQNGRCGKITKPRRSMAAGVATVAAAVPSLRCLCFTHNL